MLRTIRCVRTTVRVLAILWVMLLPAAAWAQTSIAGVVKDTTGAVLPGVTVEVASPVLIEKLRTVITEEQGLYRIIDLRPGIYTVTFTLPGFSTVKRDGLELSGAGTTLNAELRVGALEETITVSGQTPVVDVQNVVQQRVLTSDALETLPNAKSIQSMAALIPGLSAPAASRDVGGTVGDQPLGVAIHGGRAGDQHVFYDGMRSNNIQGSGGGACMSIWMNPAAIQEISMDIGSMQVESETSGFRINVIPKDGGNIFSGSVLFNGTSGGMQSDNLTDALRARGTAITKVKNIFDANAALGGPIKKDTVWFFTAHRRWGNENYVAGRYFNKNPVAWTYEPDLSRQAYEQNLHRSNSVRFTWQATQKNKLSLAVERQDQCICYTGLGSYGAGTNASPEATNYVHSFPNSYGQVKWSNALSNKLLLEAGASYNMMNWNSRRQPGLGDDIISVREQSLNLVYRAPASYSGPLMNHAAYSRAYFQSFTMSYVTGSHAVKTGVLWLHGFGYNDTHVNGNMTYAFLNGEPRTVTLRATPTHTDQNLAADLGLYLQDQWTIKRLTLNLGLRHTYFNSYLPPQYVKAGTFVPERSYPGVDDVVIWNDLLPRLGAAYDLFGDGRTAVKVSLGKYLQSEATASANAKNPVSRVVSTANRAWTDFNGNKVPDCELLNPVANAECTGPISDRLFGQTAIVSTTTDDDYLHGYGKRINNWEGSAGVQHQLRPGMAVNATYFRRWYGNLLVTHNRAVAASDYDPYCITVPVNSQLPDGGGNQLCGFYDLSLSRVGFVDNFVTFAKKFGKQTDVYDGVDLTMNARLPRGASVQGGVNIGREATDNCEVVGKVGAGSPSTNFCRVTPPFQTDLKLSGSYPLPWGGVLVSATVQSSPGAQITASYVATNAQILPTLGRNLSAGATSNATVELVAPGTLYDDRLNQVDLRVTKTVRVNRLRIRAAADVYNLFNGLTVLTLNTRYGTAWQDPFITLPGRFAKFGLTLDF